jgi:glutaminase
MSDKGLAEILDEVCRDVAGDIGRGRVASYIPALAGVDPRKFGIAVATCDGEVVIAGDADEPFSIQSVSKVFTLSLALERTGARLWQRVGREPSGSPFNSIVQLEREKGIPRNPFINAGALVVTDTLTAASGARGAIGEVLGLLRRLAGDDSVAIDEEVAASEAKTGHRNASLAHFMKGFGNLQSPVRDVLDAYFHQCAIRMSCRQLAMAARFLANGGVDPASGGLVVGSERARRINAVMMTCGHYDASGDFAFRVGLPGKSGVGGGIVAVVPGRATIAAWSPGLNEAGNSLVGALAMERLSVRAGWSVFERRAL